MDLPIAGGSRRGTVLPKKLAPSAAVTGVFKLSSILSNWWPWSVEWRGEPFPWGLWVPPAFSKEVTDDASVVSGDDTEVGSFGGQKISLLLDKVGEDGGEVAVGGEKHRRLNETQGNTRDFFLSGTSGLVPGLGKWHNVNTGSSIILILDNFSSSVLEDDSDSAEDREIVTSTGLTGELFDDNGLSTV